MSIGSHRHTNGLGDPRHSYGSSIETRSPRTSLEAVEMVGALSVTDHAELTELAEDPDAPPANRVRLYLVDDGSGNTRLCARFPTGTVWIATDPA